MNEYSVCTVCPHHCRLSEGSIGRCGARAGIGTGAGDSAKNSPAGSVPLNYGRLTALALDPIEKKPLAFFHPGSRILSAGSFGCNMACPFCQNHEIASASAGRNCALYEVSPEELCDMALTQRKNGNIGAAYTYNEALVGYEYVRDAARLIHDAGMKNVLVTNGMASLWVLEELLPYMDAMNIDLKGFRNEIYETLGGDLETVKAFIMRAHENCHIEITSLIVPGLNDSPEDMEEEASWIASLDPDIPLHITRYFPRHRMHAPATDISVMKDLQQIAGRHLGRVLLGNV